MNLESLKQKYGKRVPDRFNSLFRIIHSGDTYCAEQTICDMLDDIFKALDCMNQPHYGEVYDQVDHYIDGKTILEKMVS